MSHAGGRPTSYDPSLIYQVDDYIKGTGRSQTTLPTIDGLALHLGVDDDTIVEWGKKYPEFSAAITRVKKLQKNQLIDDGLYGGKEVNSNMAIFLLKVNHEMIEMSHLDVTSKGNELKGPTVYIPEEKDE